MSRKKIVLIVTVILFGFIYYCFFINGAASIKDSLTNRDILENVYYLVQILVGITAVMGAFIAVWQYVLYVRGENLNIKNKRIEKAIDLSEYYKDHILNMLSFLRNIFEKSGVKAYLDKINVNDMKMFDCHELDKIMDKSSKMQVANIMYSKKMFDIIIESSSIYGIKLEFNQTKEEEGEPDEKIIRHVLGCVVNDMLNNMEFFALYFTHGVADESVVFQSLHQTFIESVQLLYYNIAINNHPDGKQLYTNVVGLYNIWNNRITEKEKQYTESGRKIVGGNIAETLS